jgi:hypothetical protein
VREGVSLWWNDRSAQFLGEANGEQTNSLFETPSLNEVDASRLQAGDLAVSRSGAHILAYLGGNQWIEADPSAGSVLSVSVPASGNSWFRIPMKLVRWRFLD